MTNSPPGAPADAVWSRLRGCAAPGRSLCTTCCKEARYSPKAVSPLFRACSALMTSCKAACDPDKLRCARTRSLKAQPPALSAGAEMPISLMIPRAMHGFILTRLQYFSWISVTSRLDLRALSVSWHRATAASSLERPRDASANGTFHMKAHDAIGPGWSAMYSTAALPCGTSMRLLSKYVFLADLLPGADKPLLKHTKLSST